MKKLLALAIAGVLLLGSPAIAGECPGHASDDDVADVAARRGFPAPVRIDGAALERYREGLRELAGHNVLEEATTYLLVVATPAGFVYVIEMGADGCSLAELRVSDELHAQLTAAAES